MVSCVGVLTCIEIMHQSVFALSFALLKNGPFLHLSRLEMVAFSRILSIPKIPVARRSSVSRANPFLIESPGLRFLISLPLSFKVPLRLVATPKIFSSSSVLPEPSSPATPIISPFRALKLTSFSLAYSELKLSASNKTSPISLVLGG